MIVASTGRSLVAAVWRADEPDAYSTISPTPAPTASAHTTMPPDASGWPSTSQARTTRRGNPSRVGSLRVATSVPMTLPSTMARLLLRRAGAAERQHGVDVGVRPRDHVDRDHLADALGGALAGLGGGAHRGDVAAHDRGDEAAAGLLVTDQLDLGGLHHGVGGLDHAGEPLHFDHSKRVSHSRLSSKLLVDELVRFLAGDAAQGGGGGGRASVDLRLAARHVQAAERA